MAQSNAHRWLLESLESDASFLSRPMFGCLAAYYRGRLVLVLADKVEPWSGVLVPVERSEHVSIQADFDDLYRFEKYLISMSDLS